MAALARLLLLLISAAFLWNLARGTHREWLRAKFLGDGSLKVKPLKPTRYGQAFA